MHLSKIDTINSSIEFESVRETILFDEKDIERFTPMQMLVAYKQISNNYSKRFANKIFSLLYAELQLAEMAGEISDCPALHFVPPQEVLTLDEVTDFFGALPVMEARAIMVGMLDNLSEIEVAVLNYEDDLRDLCRASKSIISKTPRRLGCGIIFWKESEPMSISLIQNLEGKIYDRFECSWNQFRLKLGNVILLDDIDEIALNF